MAYSTITARLKTHDVPDDEPSESQHEIAVRRDYSKGDPYEIEEKQP